MVAIVARFFLNVLAREGVAGKHATATALLLLFLTWKREREDGGKCSLVGNAFKEGERKKWPTQTAARDFLSPFHFTPSKHF